jgi:multicomponent Na+:H+ antiporter subunit F
MTHAIPGIPGNITGSIVASADTLLPTDGLALATMVLSEYPWAVLVAHVMLGVLGISMACSGVRLLLGPSLPDRVVALDLMIIATVAVAAILAVVYDQPALIDLAVLLALTAFIGTVALSWFIERTRA